MMIYTTSLLFSRRSSSSTTCHGNTCETQVQALPAVGSCLQGNCKGIAEDELYRYFKGDLVRLAKIDCEENEKAYEF